MNLVIDIGNTSAKVYLFENDQIVSKKHLNEVSLIEYVLPLNLYEEETISVVVFG